MLNDRKATDITLINHVVEAARGGSMRAAKGELLNALAADPNNVGAWWLMSIIAETPELRRLYLYQVLYLSPNHEQAKRQLRRLNNDGSDPLLSYLTDKEEREAVDTPAADQPVVESPRVTASIDEIAPANESPAGASGDPDDEADEDTAYFIFQSDEEPPRVTASIDEIAPANESPAGASGDLPGLDGEDTAYFIFQSDEEMPRPLVDDGSGAAIAEPAADEPAEPVRPEWRPPPAANGHFSPANEFPATDAYANGDTARMQAAAATTAPPGDQTAAAAGLPFPQTLLKRGLGLLDGTGERTKILLFAVFYLILLTAAELLTVFVFVRVGALLHALTLLMLLAHTVRRMGSPDHRLWAAISLVPLIRIVSLTLPLDDFTLPYWFLFTSIPLFAAGYIIMRLLSMSWDEAGVNLRGLPLQLLISLLGLALGYIEYQILQPEPLIDELTLARFWLPALIILISTGFLEELLFRGILQGAAVGVLGPALGVVYGALYFGVLHVGYQSLADVLFVTAVGLVFGWIVLKTRSIIGVSLAHGLTNITLFLIMPFMAGGSLALPF